MRDQDNRACSHSPPDIPGASSISLLYAVYPENYSLQNFIFWGIHIIIFSDGRFLFCSS